MEVSPFLFKWLVELNIIEQNEKDNFISDDIIYYYVEENILIEYYILYKMLIINIIIFI